MQTGRKCAPSPRRRNFVVKITVFYVLGACALAVVLRKLLLRLQLSRHVEKRQRLVEPPLYSQGVAQIGVGPRMIGLEPEQPAVGGDGLIGPAGFVQGDAEVVQGLGVVSSQFQRAAETADGPVPLPRPPVGLPQVMVILRGLGVDGDRPADQLDRHVRATHLASERAEQVQCVGMIRNLGQDLAIDSLGLGQAAGLMMPQSDLDRLLDRQESSSSLPSRIRRFRVAIVPKIQPEAPGGCIVDRVVEVAAVEALRAGQRRIERERAEVEDE